MIELICLEWLQLDTANSNSLIRIPRYFELKIISPGFAIQSYTLGYFELPLFRAIFRFPLVIAGFSGSWIWTWIGLI